jgi:hypothetical protein
MLSFAFLVKLLKTQADMSPGVGSAICFPQHVARIGGVRLALVDVISRHATLPFDCTQRAPRAYRG